jgi:hypothetical protein
VRATVPRLNSPLSRKDVVFLLALLMECEMLAVLCFSGLIPVNRPKKCGSPSTKVLASDSPRLSLEYGCSFTIGILLTSSLVTRPSPLSTADPVHVKGEKKVISPIKIKKEKVEDILSMYVQAWSFIYFSDLNLQ